MILQDYKIKSWATIGGIIPYDETHINPASIDICVGNRWIDLDTDKSYITDTFIIYPRSIAVELYNMFATIFHFHTLPMSVLLTTYEYVNIPSDMAGEIKLKSTPSRNGLGHPIADWIDPGYAGELTLMLHAIRPVKLMYKQRICQLVLHKLDSNVEMPYKEKGHYYGQVGPTKAWDNNNV